MFLAAFCCEDALLVHVQLAVYQNLRSLSTEVLPKQWSSVRVVARGSGVLPFHMRYLAVVLIEFHHVHVGPVLQPAEAPPDGGPAFECIDFSSNLGSSAKWTRPHPLPPPGH